MKDVSCGVVQQCAHEDDVTSCQAPLDDGADLVKVGVARECRRCPIRG